MQPDHGILASEASQYFQQGRWEELERPYRVALKGSRMPEQSGASAHRHAAIFLGGQATCRPYIYQHGLLSSLSKLLGGR